MVGATPAENLIPLPKRTAVRKTKINVRKDTLEVWEARLEGDRACDYVCVAKYSLVPLFKDMSEFDEEEVEI